jgi:hypothetical protein
MRADRKDRQPVLPPTEQTHATQKSICCRVRYRYESGRLTYAVDGFTRDGSRMQCGTQATMIPPIKTRVTLDLLDQEPVLCLKATITWIAEDSFGAHFPAVNAKDYSRIRRYMRNLPNR